MPRSVNSVSAKNRRKKILKQAKGYWGRRKNVFTVAKNAVEKALLYSYRDRKAKKRVFRSLWIQRINAGCREYGISYSKFISLLNKSDIQLNRKTLSNMAMNKPDEFKELIKKVNS